MSQKRSLLVLTPSRIGAIFDPPWRVGKNCEPCLALPSLARNSLLAELKARIRRKKSTTYDRSPLATSAIPVGRICEPQHLKPACHMCGFLGEGCWCSRDSAGAGSELLIRSRELGTALASTAIPTTFYSALGIESRGQGVGRLAGFEAAPPDRSEGVCETDETSRRHAAQAIGTSVIVVLKLMTHR